jgi:hypothetical protein
MSKTLLGRLLLTSAALALASCGGGGGGPDLASTPPPPATQVCWNGAVIPVTQTCPPQPPPTPPASPAIFPGVTTNTNFAVLGLEASATNIPASALARNGFSVRYEAATQGYLVDLPSRDEFRFESNSQDASFWHGFAATGFYEGTIIDVFKPSSTNPEIQLSYTSYGITSGYYTSDFGFFAFGSATPGAGVPVTGTANYDALIRGRALDSFGRIDGDATFQFNFGTGTLAGHFDPVLELNGVVTDLGTYNFVSTVFGVGSPTFSGGLSRVGAPSLGAFDGRFTGPAAEELMARWTAPYLNPSTQQWNEMFGVMVGKKQ